MSSPTIKIPKVTPCQTMRGHTNFVRRVVHLPGGRRIITCSWLGSLRLWDLESGIQIGDCWRDGKEELKLCTIALSPNGSTVASGSDDGMVRLWDVKTEKVIAKWKGHTKSVSSACWGADGKRVVSGSVDGTASIWDVKSSKTVLGPIKTWHGHVWVVIFTPDSTKFATGGYSNGVKIWDAKTGELLTTLKHLYNVGSLVWTSDGKKLIIAAMSNGQIRIFDTATWELITILEGHTEHVKAISLSQSNRLLASASWDKTARLWNLDTNLPVGPPLQHKDLVQCAALSTDGTVLVTGGEDKDVYAWDIQAILKKARLEDLLLPDIPARKPPMNRNSTRRPPIPTRPGFFVGVRGDIHSSTSPSVHHSSSHRVLAPSMESARVLFARIPSLFLRSHSRTSNATELQQTSRQGFFSRHGPRTVEVAAVRDKKPLFVAPSKQQQQQQSQSHDRGSSSQSQPAATSTSTTQPTPNTNSSTQATTPVYQP